MISQPVLHPDFSSEDQPAKLQDLLAQLASLTQRVASLEHLAMAVNSECVAGEAPISPAQSQSSIAEASPVTSSPAVEAGISEQEVLAICSAIAAWLGVHAHIRQIRLIRTHAWSQQGRVTIQASHILNLNH